MDYEYKKVQRGIFGSTDFESFQKCPVDYMYMNITEQALQELKDFVRKCGDSVINTKRSDVSEMSPVRIHHIVDFVVGVTVVGYASSVQQVDR